MKGRSQAAIDVVEEKLHRLVQLDVDGSKAAAAAYDRFIFAWITIVVSMALAVLRAATLA